MSDSWAKAFIQGAADSGGMVLVFAIVWISALWSTTLLLILPCDLPPRTGPGADLFVSSACRSHGWLAGSATTACSLCLSFRCRSLTTALSLGAPPHDALSAVKLSGKAAKYDRTDMGGQPSGLACDSSRVRLCGVAPASASLRADMLADCAAPMGTRRPPLPGLACDSKMEVHATRWSALAWRIREDGKSTARDSSYLAQFLLETRRAELAHWCMLCCLPLFFLWNPPWACLVMTAYALAANLPCILAQRYNRIAIDRAVRTRHCGSVLMSPGGQKPDPVASAASIPGASFVIFDRECESGRYIARICPWAARNGFPRETCERAFADECELIATVNPLLPPGSDVRDVFEHIESQNGFYLSFAT